MSPGAPGGERVIEAAGCFAGDARGVLANVRLTLKDGADRRASSPCPGRAAGPRRLLLPAFVNAHDHARPTASSFGALNMPLETWILRSALARRRILTCKPQRRWRGPCTPAARP